MTDHRLLKKRGYAMHSTIEILNKPVRIEWSKAAEAALADLAEPLCGEMEVYFSCLIRKKVRFGDKAHSRVFERVNSYLQVAFRPVMTKKCAVGGDNTEVPLEDFPVVNPAAFVPHWLRIDHRHGNWEGEFGFGSS